MYNSFFKLHSSPFGTSPDPRFLYMMPHTREALAALAYGIFSTRRVSTAFVFNPRLEVLDFLEFVLTDFGIVPATRTKSGMLLQLNRWLIERFRMEETCVVVVDEAQNLSWELLEEIRLLTNLETSSEKLLQIVLSGQPELEEKLRHPSVRQLRQRVALWCRTQALTETQTHAYVAERLRLAGAAYSIFTPEALELVHRYSRGIPRVINLLCEHALIVAYVEQVPQVTAPIIEGVAAELELETQPFLISSVAMGGGSSRGTSGGEISGLMTAFDGDTKGRQDR